MSGQKGCVCVVDERGLNGGNVGGGRDINIGEIGGGVSMGECRGREG